MRVFHLSLLSIVALMSAGPAFAVGELEERAIISTLTQRAFLLEDFSKLEEVSRVYRDKKSRTSSGLWKLSLFYGGIEDGMYALTWRKEREAAFRELESKTRRWAQRYPNSPSAHIAHSMALIRHAWAIRGDGFASTVEPEAWAPFLDYIALARQNLEIHKSAAATDPRWYATMLTVARTEGWERDRFDRLLDEALGREPLFYETYFAALEYLLPKWHGGTREIEAFVRAAVRRTSDEEGRGMYARIYWYASQTEFGSQLFTKSLVAWSRMKGGFEDVVARYPDAWNLNNYARFACLAKDKRKARELLKRTAAEIVAEAWQPSGLREHCSGWAFGKEPPQA